MAHPCLTWACRWLLAACWLACTACETAPPPSKPSAYFSLAGLVDAQVAQLKAAKPTVQRQLETNGQNHQNITANIDWEKELALFKEADINKPVLQGAYQVEQRDSVRRYLLTNPKFPVKEMRIVGPEAAPNEVQVWFEEENSLYKLHRRLWLQFAGGRLRQYRIEGFQQMLLSDSTHYRLEGTLP